MALDQINIDELLKKINSPEAIDQTQMSGLTSEPIAPLTWTYDNTITGISDPAYGAIPTYSVNSGGTSATGIWTTTHKIGRAHV